MNECLNYAAHETSVAQVDQTPETDGTRTVRALIPVTLPLTVFPQQGHLKKTGKNSFNNNQLEVKQSH